MSLALVVGVELVTLAVRLRKDASCPDPFPLMRVYDVLLSAPNDKVSDSDGLWVSGPQMA